MSYSSYKTQQQMLERTLRLEIMLVALIRQTQSGVEDPSLRGLLLNFAGVVDSELNLEKALEQQQEVANALEKPE